jgi:hypothetical protein
MEPTRVSTCRFEVPAAHRYVGLLARAASRAAWTQRLGQLRGGTPLRPLVAELFGTAEPARRFA